MKIVFLGIATALLLVVSLNHSARADLVAYYDFETGSGTTVMDQYGGDTPANGTFSGDPNWVAGKVGNYALEFNGTSDYVNCGDNAKFNISQQMTITAWLKAPQTFSPTYRMWISKGNTAGWRSCQSGAGASLIWGVNADNANVYGIKTVLDDTWHHVAVTYKYDDGFGTAKIYVDGELDNAGGFAFPILTNALDVAIGGNPVGYPDGLWQGLIDDLGIWNQALIQEEIEYIRDNSVADWEPNMFEPPVITPDPNIDADLVGYWPFNETSGDITIDRSVNTNDGILVGGTFETKAAADRLGNPGGAITFPGDSAFYVNCGNNQSLNLTNGLSIAAWVKVPETVNAWSTLVAKEVDFAYQGYYTLMVHNGSANMGSDHAVTSWVANGSSHGNLTGTPNGVKAGEWHFIGMTCDATNLTLYLDGKVDGAPLAIGGTAPITTLDSNLIIGTSLAFGGRGFAGDVDEVAIWNGALTPEEMIYVYQSGVPTPPLGCRDIGEYYPADLNRDCYINLEDFAILAANWLKCNDPQRPECTDIP